MSLKTGTARPLVAMTPQICSNEVVARKQMLLFLVPGVVPVLADQQHPVDSQGIATQRQSGPNAWEDRLAVLGGDLAADVAV